MSVFAVVAGRRRRAAPPPGPALPANAKGVNLAGAEFAPTVLPGTKGTTFAWPTATEIQYYAGKGFTLARIPFLMERVWADQTQDISCPYLVDLLATVDAVRNAGMWAMPDMHNYWRYYGNLVTKQQLVYVWGRLALAFGARDKLILGLMNEPNGIAASTVVEYQNAAITEIRAMGYEGVISVSGTAWSGAHSWSTSGNAAAFASLIADPGVVIEVHQYLDADGAGDSTNCAIGTGSLAGDGIFRLSPVTTWGRASNRKFLLTEWDYTPSDTTCQSWVVPFLAHMSTNNDVWCGHTYWANWPTAITTNRDANPKLLNPLSNGTDRPQIYTIITGQLPQEPEPLPTYPVVRLTAGTRTGSASQKAYQANDFVDRCGCLIPDATTIQTDSMIDLVGRFIRIRSITAYNNLANAQRMGAAGVRFITHGGVYSINSTTGAVQTPSTAAQIMAHVKAIGVDYFIGVASVNEPNRRLFGTASAYWNYLRTYQKSLWDTFKADPATRDKVLVLSPGWAFADRDPAKITDIGDISAWTDGSEIHAYARANNMAERTDIYDNVGPALQVAGDPKKPVFMGECGWHVYQPDWPTGKDAVLYKDRLTPRMFLYHYDHGFAVANYTMPFNLNLAQGVWSNASVSTDSEDYYGWVKASGEKQPAYNSSRNLFTMLNDPGPRFTPGTLAYTITGSTTNLCYVLFQKRTGRFYLAVWVATYDPATRAITINLPTSITNARRGRPNTNTTWTTQAITNNTISYTADSYVTLFELY